MLLLSALACTAPTPAPSTGPPAAPASAQDGRRGGLVLTVDPLAWGVSSDAVATGAAPGEVVSLGWSLAGEGPGPCPPTLGGLCLDLGPPVGLLAQAAANGAGVATFTLPVPDGGPPLTALSLQAVVDRDAQSIKSAPVTTTVRGGGSFWFVENAPYDYDYGQQLAIPPAFGQGEFTLELWIRPDDSYPVGPAGGGLAQRQNWSNADNAPYSSPSWWYEGNFLLDGHNNLGFSDGTFSLQFYGGGRVRWLFGDGADPGDGGVWSSGAYPAANAPTLLDGGWHHVAAVRRWEAGGGADLELWVDGVQVGLETTPARTDMRGWFDGWAGFPYGQEGWFWGAEKQAAIGALPQYEDFKGLLTELRFWSLAVDAKILATSWDRSVDGSEPGLVGWIPFTEADGTQVCDGLAPGCIALYGLQPTGGWLAASPPLQ